MKKIVNKLLVLLICIFIFSGCAKIKTYTAYTIYPVGYILNRIGGNRIKTISVQTNDLVQVARPVTADEENPGFQDIINDSIYFFHIGDLEPYLEIYEDEINQSEANVVDLSVLNAIYKFQRYTLVTANGRETYIESPYYDGDIFDSIDVYDTDLFLWLDPIGMLSMAKTVYSTLANNYVEQSAFFKENYEALEADLIEVDARYQALSTKLKAESKTIKFVSMTPSFGSWQKSYGFQVYPVCLSKYGALPSEAQLEAIKQRIIADDVRYIVYEPNMTAEMNELFNELADELNLTRVNLSNLSSLTSTQINDGKDYLSIMYENLSVLENIAVQVTTTTELVNVPEED